jgi:hypothetical protein
LKETEMLDNPETLCPSAQPEWEGARLFAVVGGTADRPETAYLDQALPVTDELLKLAGPVAPTEVFRFAAPCANKGCAHFDTGRGNCRLVERTVSLTPVVVDKLAPCAIRKSCRWWQQEGVVACQRCPQVVTLNYAPSERMREAATPDNLMHQADNNLNQAMASV